MAWLGLGSPSSVSSSTSQSEVDDETDECDHLKAINIRGSVQDSKSRRNSQSARSDVSIFNTFWQSLFLRNWITLADGSVENLVVKEEMREELREEKKEES
jgi:hypothetical protein